MTDASPATYPRHYYSKELDQVAVVRNYADDLQFLNRNRYGFKAAKLFVPLPYPKTMENCMTGEQRQVSEWREEEQLSANWRDKESLQPPAKPEPVHPHLYRPDSGNLQSKPYRNRDEERELRAAGFKSHHELWPGDEACQKSK